MIANDFITEQLEFILQQPSNAEKSFQTTIIKKYITDLITSYAVI